MRPILVSLPPRRGPFEHSPGSRMPIESTESASTERESPHMRQSLFLSKSGEGERGKNSTSKKKETRRRKKPSPCRRLGAEGTACQAPQTQTSMSGPGSLLSEGARAAGVRPGGACRRPFKVEFEFFFFFSEGERERTKRGKLGHGTPCSVVFTASMRPHSPDIFDRGARIKIHLVPGAGGSHAQALYRAIPSRASLP